MPTPTEPSKPIGFPNATTNSPCRTASESPNVTWFKPVRLILITAMSISRSLPTKWASSSFGLGFNHSSTPIGDRRIADNRTWIWRAPLTTCALVTM